MTQRGECDPTYGFSVNIPDGIVTHPNLVKFRGYVARSGAARASVTVHGKYASGTDRLRAMPAMETGAAIQELPVAQDIGRHNETDYTSRSAAQPGDGE